MAHFRTADALFRAAYLPEDVDVPLSVVGELWGISEVETRRTLRRIEDLGVIKLDLNARSIRLHDVIRAYLHQQLIAPSAVHARLADAWAAHVATTHYGRRWLAYHLEHSGRHQELAITSRISTGCKVG